MIKTAFTQDEVASDGLAGTGRQGSGALAEEHPERAPWTGRAKFARDHGDAFFQAVKRRVARYIEEQGKSRFDDGTIALKGLGFAGLAAIFYALVLSNAYPAWALLMFAIGFGVSALLLAINVGHDAAHQALTRHRWLNHLIQTICFLPLGANAYLWRLRHVKSHHVFPNVNGCDIDIDDTVFLRLSPNRPPRRYHRYQHLYAPIVYWLVGLHTAVYQDFVYLFKRRLANMSDIRHPPFEYASFVLEKVGYVSIVFLIPMMVMERPWWHIAVGVLVMTSVMSVVFVALLIGTHFSEAAKFPAVESTGRIPHSWAVHAMITSVDWNPTSKLANFFVGGANAHAAHHLFPTFAHIHYVPITRIIERTAREFGMPYNRTTLWGMIRSHFAFLRRMGRGEAREAPPRRPLKAWRQP